MQSDSTPTQEYTFQAQHEYSIGLSDEDYFQHIPGDQITKTDLGISFPHQAHTDPWTHVNGIKLHSQDRICLPYHQITTIIEHP